MHKLNLETIVKNTEVSVNDLKAMKEKVEEKVVKTNLEVFLEGPTRDIYKSADELTNEGLKPSKDLWYVIEEICWCGREHSKYTVAKFESEKEALKHCDKLNKLTKGANELYYISELEMWVKVRGGYMSKAASDYFLKGINYEGV